MDNDLQAIAKVIEERKNKEQSTAVAVVDETPQAEETMRAKTQLDVVNEQKQKDYKAISANEDFQRQSLSIHARGVSAALREEEVEIEDQELRNELQAYAVKKKKEELDYRAKKEKDIVRQEVKAQVFEKKYEIARKRYGYLYTSKTEKRTDADGNEYMVEVPPKDFTPNKVINKLKEITHYYNNLSKTAQHAIWITVKLVLVVGAVALVGWLGWELIKFISSNGIIK